MLGFFTLSIILSSVADAVLLGMPCLHVLKADSVSSNGTCLQLVSPGEQLKPRVGLHQKLFMHAAAPLLESSLLENAPAARSLHKLRWFITAITAMTDSSAASTAFVH